MGDCKYCEIIPYQYDPDEGYAVCNADSSILSGKGRSHCPYAENENWEDCPIAKEKTKLMIEKIYKCLVCESDCPCILRIQVPDGSNEKWISIPTLCPITKDNKAKWELIE